MKDNPVNDKEIRAFLEEGCFFEGKLQFTGVVRLNGSFVGEIESNDTLILGESSHFSGKIKVGSLIAAGTIEGEVTAKERIELLGTSKVSGQLFTERFISFEGCVLDAKIATISHQKESKGKSKELNLKVVDTMQTKQESTVVKNAQGL